MGRGKGSCESERLRQGWRPDWEETGGGPMDWGPEDWGPVNMTDRLGLRIKGYHEDQVRMLSLAVDVVVVPGKDLCSGRVASERACSAAAASTIYHV